MVDGYCLTNWCGVTLHVQSWQVKCGKNHFGSRLPSFWCDAACFKLFNHYCIHEQLSSHRGGACCRTVCADPRDSSVFHLPQLEYCMKNCVSSQNTKQRAEALHSDIFLLVGFMMENSAWSGSKTRTIQFVLPSVGTLCHQCSLGTTSCRFLHQNCYSRETLLLSVHIYERICTLQCWLWMSLICTYSTASCMLACHLKAQEAPYQQGLDMLVSTS